MPLNYDLKNNFHVLLFKLIQCALRKKESSVLSQVKLLCAKAHDLWDTLAVKMFLKLGPSNKLHWLTNFIATCMYLLIKWLAD